jgi:hypothetical protein
MPHEARDLFEAQTHGIDVPGRDLDLHVAPLPRSFGEAA